MTADEWSCTPGAGSGPRTLDSLGIPASLGVLVLAPHPDDFDAIGVTMRKLFENGNRLSVVVMRTGSGVEDGYCSPGTIERMAEVRDAEQRASCRLFGLPEESLRLIDVEQDETAQPVDSPANVSAVAGLLSEFAPGLVFLPHGNDTNSGHRAVSALLDAALERIARPPEAIFYNMDPKTIDLRRDVYTPFGADLAAWKGALLRCHDSQHQRNLNARGHGFDERILAGNRAAAAALGVDEPCAEVFEVQPGSA